MRAVRIPLAVAKQITAHARQHADEEVCGLISSVHQVPMHVYPVANVSNDRTHLFDMDPAGQIDALRQMRERGHELFAIYHSHPHGRAVPSARDLEHVGYPDVLYLIVAPESGGAMQIKAYYLRAYNEVQEVALEIEA